MSLMYVACFSVIGVRCYVTVEGDRFAPATCRRRQVCAKGPLLNPKPSSRALKYSRELGRLQTVRIDPLAIPNIQLCVRFQYGDKSPIFWIGISGSVEIRMDFSDCNTHVTPT